MDQILDCCKGVIGITDDIIMHGKDDAEHDRRLHKFMKVTREHGLVLNKEKCKVKSNSVKFFGCVYNKHRAHPDPPKVSATKEMPAPQNKGELQSFLGMVTYVSPFILQLSSHTVTRSHTHPRWWYSCLCFQSAHTHRTALCKQWEGTTRLCLQCRMFSDICFWLTLHDWEWPQVTRTDLHEESGRCPSTLTEDVTLTSGLWFHNQVSPRRGNGCGRHLIKILTWEYTRDSPRHLCQPCIHWCWEETRLSTRNQGWPTVKCPCRQNHCWMARWYQGCSKSIMTIPWTMWFTHCRGQTYPMWRSNHCSPRREEEGLGINPSRTLRHIQVPIQG